MEQNNGWFRLEDQKKVQPVRSKADPQCPDPQVIPRQAPMEEVCIEETPQAPEQIEHPALEVSPEQAVVEEPPEASLEVEIVETIALEEEAAPPLRNNRRVPQRPRPQPKPPRAMANRHSQQRAQTRDDVGHLLDPYEDEPRTLHSQTVGARGPVVMEDQVLHETLDEFVHSKPRERAVHVKGFGAFGYFHCYQSMRDYTKLNFLQGANQRTEVAARFSLAVSNRGTPDTGRNVRGFSVKFYTEGGVFDLLCNHIPVFLVRDGMRFPESIKSFLPSPVNNLADPTRFWDFISRTPEATHFVTWLYSDVGTIKSLRHIRAYGVNTYVWENAAGLRRLVKYHWLPLAGEQSIDRMEANRLAGSNPDICGQDLYDAIAQGQAAEYELCVQLMDFADVAALPYDPLDCTKIWDEEQYPLVSVGKLVLDRNPQDYWEQIEKLAFSPMNLLEGAQLSHDKMLQGRSFVYWDAQRFRLGPEFRRIPVNAQTDWTPDDIVSSNLGEEACGPELRVDVPKQDNFAQAGERYQALSAEQRGHLVDNIASELYAMPEVTRQTVMGYFEQASEELAAQLWERMNLYASKRV